MKCCRTGRRLDRPLPVSLGTHVILNPASAGDGPYDIQQLSRSYQDSPRNDDGCPLPSPGPSELLSVWVTSLLKFQELMSSRVRLQPVRDRTTFSSSRAVIRIAPETTPVVPCHRKAPPSCARSG